MELLFCFLVFSYTSQNTTLYVNELRVKALPPSKFSFIGIGTNKIKNIETLIMIIKLILLFFVMFIPPIHHNLIIFFGFSRQ